MPCSMREMPQPMALDPGLAAAYAQDTFQACEAIRVLVLDGLEAPDSSVRQALEITLHGVKGAASALAIADAGPLCHALESLLRLPESDLSFVALLPALLQGTAELEAQALAVQAGASPAFASTFLKGLMHLALGEEVSREGFERWPPVLVAEDDNDDLEALFEANRRAPPIPEGQTDRDPIEDLGVYLASQAAQLAQELGKAVAFDFNLPAQSLPRAQLSVLRTQLGHLLRNALDHGIEPSSERVALGKATEGRLSLQGTLDDGILLLAFSDDGRGIDFSKLRSRWAEPGAMPEDPLELLATPGLSVQESATLVSGRGLGVAAVREALGKLGGDLAVSSAPKSGTVFTLRLPLPSP